METSFFVRGLLIGFSIAAVVGPICLLCIHRTLHNGSLYGLVTGLGAATADAVYGGIAAFGLTVIATFLVYLGIKTVFTRPARQAAKGEANNFFGAYASTLLLTLTNPLTILSFAAIFAGIGVGGTGRSYLAATIVVWG